MSGLTVEKLNDYVQSQLCVHGNQKVFVRNLASHAPTFTLYAGGKSIIDCGAYDETCIEDSSLEMIAERLKDIDPNEMVHVSDGANFKDGFQIGYRSKDDGFVETLNHNELNQPTSVEGC